MCGLLAVHAPDGTVDRDRLDAGLARIAHRGPDARRTAVLDDGRVGLGHARLRVVGGRSGDQPLRAGGLALVLNGELYDHDRLRAELAARGHRLRTGSDSEIVLHLYEERGTGCLAGLRGEFAFVLWDGARGRLFPPRDRLGAKPLLYARAGSGLLLASEAKALFGAGVQPRWDPEAFFQFSHSFLGQDRTLFDGVRQVPPGHLLLAEDGEVRTARYWDLDFPPTPGPGGRCDPAEAAAAVRAELDTAVRLRMRADVRVGCYLSGGLDSAAVLGLAARHAPGPVDAFTVRFDEDPGADDECAAAAVVAARAGARSHPVPVGRTALADHFADAVWHAESILPDTNTVAKYLLSRAARDAGCRVVLTGEGADELFGGYAFLRGGGPGRGPDPAGRRAGPGPGVPRPGAQALPTGRVAELLGAVPPILEACAQAAVHQRALLRPGYLAGVAGRDALGEFVERLDVPGQLAGRDRLHQSSYLLCKSLLPNYLLAQLGDRTELAHGVEGRLPFLDHALVELVRTFPPRLLTGGPVEKPLLRAAAAPVLGPAAWARRKRVFWAPAALGPGDPVHRMLQDVLRGPGLRAQPFYDRRAVLALLDTLPRLARVPEALAGVSMLLVGVASACVLHERFGL